MSLLWADKGVCLSYLSKGRVPAPDPETSVGWGLETSGQLQEFCSESESKWGAIGRSRGAPWNEKNVRFSWPISRNPARDFSRNGNFRI